MPPCCPLCFPVRRGLTAGEDPDLEGRQGLHHHVTDRSPDPRARGGTAGSPSEGSDRPHTSTGVGLRKGAGRRGREGGAQVVPTKVFLGVKGDPPPVSAWAT